MTSPPFRLAVARSVTEGDLSVLSISGENVTVRDTVVRANRNGTDHTQAVAIDGASDVDLDVNVRGAFAENPITVTGGDRIRLDARITDADYDEGGTHLIDEISDLSITGAAHHGGRGVRIVENADATNVTVRDFTHTGIDRPSASRKRPQSRISDSTASAPPARTTTSTSVERWSTGCG